VRCVALLGTRAAPRWGRIVAGALVLTVNSTRRPDVGAVTAAPSRMDQALAGASSASSCWTRRSMSSRMRRTTSTGWPAGSSSSQSSYRLPG
jgi:hypothetical protein